MSQAKNNSHQDTDLTVRGDLFAQTAPERSHRVSAIYTTSEEAERVRQHLIDSGIDAKTVVVLHDLSPSSLEDGDDEVLKDMLVAGAIGTAVGTGVGAIGTAVIWATSVTLFVASPLLAPLAMLGWFAGVGGVAGAVAGAASPDFRLGKQGRFSELVRDAIQSGSVVLVVRTQREEDQELAKKIIGQSLKGHHAVVRESS